MRPNSVVHSTMVFKDAIQSVQQCESVTITLCRDEIRLWQQVFDGNVALRKNDGPLRTRWQKCG